MSICTVHKAQDCHAGCPYREGPTTVDATMPIYWWSDPTQRLTKYLRHQGGVYVVIVDSRPPGAIDGKVMCRVIELVIPPNDRFLLVGSPHAVAIHKARIPARMHLGSQLIIDKAQLQERTLSDLVPAGTLLSSEPPSLATTLTALIGTLDNVSPRELAEAKRCLRDFSDDLANIATQRRIASALWAALDEVR